MIKVMTRNRRRPSTRPPGRPDARRPSGTPPRAPGGDQARTTAPDDRPRGNPHHPAPGPADTRPPTATGTRRPITLTTGRRRATRPPARAANAAVRPAPGAGHAIRATSVPADAAHGPVPQPEPTDLFADRLLAVLSGRRPVHWMLRHTAGPAYDDLVRLAERRPLRTRGPHPVVRDIGYFEPRPGAIEAFARIGAGDRLRAMAFRLERGRDLRWRCTAVELGGPRTPRVTED
ncbi:MAG TPA: Rv3235 family protein [Streptomyces sp.]|nr:Rv3235 family protein [Streptomyces sp.]